MRVKVLLNYFYSNSKNLEICYEKRKCRAESDNQMIAFYGFGTIALACVTAIGEIVPVTWYLEGSANCRAVKVSIACPNHSTRGLDYFL
jgi:hypothetical protein